MANVLGVSALFHDSSVALLTDGVLRSAMQEERFSRNKCDGGLPWRAMRRCLDEAGLSIGDIDVLAYYEDPGMKLDRQLSMLAAETRPEVAGRLLGRIDASRPYRALREGLGYDGPIQCVPHHVSHAASAFYYSGFDEAAILVLDAVGEWTTASAGHGSTVSGIRMREVDRFPHSLGLFYSTVTSYIGFEVNEGEYKTMGLAPMGNPRFVDQLRQMISSDEEGAVRLDLAYFDFVGLRRMWSDAFTDLIGQPPRAHGEDLTQWHSDLAASVQVILEEIVLRKAAALRERTAARRLCMAGGVALNCVATAALRCSGVFEDIFVQPASGDAGGAVGAAAQVSWELCTPPPVARLEHVYLGPSFNTDGDVIPILEAVGAPFRDYRGDEDALLDDVVARVAAGQVIGWFQGRMEFGPRALGARSILADPRLPDMRDRINGMVKMRESFRPFAPSVLLEHAGEYFDCAVPQPFMTETVQSVVDFLPAVTHIDGSARVQTVHRETHPRYARLLERFHAHTGCAVLLNTSFNQRGEPIVCTPTDAYACFVRSRLDALVIEDVVVDGRDLPVAPAAFGPADKRTDAAELAVYRLA
ncbi:carbamoyltransferase family protein [Streptomyces sp. BE230]|uniref:carbamoyltransferase family protein n=1 Tax=Streptomyces sp. BE230 TaxID=3002526 RepID=UPI002ED3909D|nr:carbamoyltransferase C-terminal domain-containing protein [Streptomyces sp. BE230]